MSSRGRSESGIFGNGLCDCQWGWRLKGGCRDCSCLAVALVQSLPGTARADGCGVVLCKLELRFLVRRSCPHRKGPSTASLMRVLLGVDLTSFGVVEAP